MTRWIRMTIMMNVNSYNQYWLLQLMLNIVNIEFNPSLKLRII